VGLDGCRGGWVLAQRDASGTVLCRVIERLDDLAHQLPIPDLVGIDIPLGLPERGARDCDVKARRRLGLRGSSVFPAPVRAVLHAAEYAEANARHRATDGRGLSKQAWNLIPKIREADALAHRSREWQARMHEVHPELSFAMLAGGVPLPAAKRTPLGQRLRRDVLRAAFGADAVDQALEGRDRRAAQADDALDALAVLWSAERLARGDALVLGDPAARDATGLMMRIAG
jgi:predicted RNase H-like nuclease